jgi:hypothetical protein
MNMERLNTNYLKAYVKDNGVVYQPINCLIEADDEDTIHMKDFISSQIKDGSWEVLTKPQVFEKGFEELAEWAIDTDCIVAIELEKPINEEYYVSICFPKKQYNEFIATLKNE